MGFNVDFGASGQIQQDGNQNAKVNLPLTRSQAGYSTPLAEISQGTDPAGQVLRAYLISEARRQRAGLDSMVFYESFGCASNAGASSANINQNTLRQTTGTMTITGGTQNTGFMQLNNNATTTASTGALVNTYRTFSLRPRMTLEFGFRAKYQSGDGNRAHKIFEIGAFQATSASAAGLLDGVAFRWAADGSFVAVRSINGTEVTNAIATIPSDAVCHEYRIVVSPTRVEYWIDDALQVVQTPTAADASATGQQFCQQLAMRISNDSTGPTVAARLDIADCWVIENDESAERSESSQQAMMGLDATMEPPGQVVGMTPNIVNSTNPSSGSGSNTTPSFQGLGGDWAINAPTGAATDYAVWSFTNPQIGATAAAKQLVITGIHISCANVGAAVATTPTQLFFYLAWGHTADSLATADGVAAHAPRRMALGGMTIAVGAAIGAMYDKDIHITFATPKIVNPGERVALVMKVPTGTNTASQSIRGVTGVEGYWK